MLPSLQMFPVTLALPVQRAPVRASAVPQKGAVAEKRHSRLPKDLTEAEKVAPKTVGQEGHGCACACVIAVL